MAYGSRYSIHPFPVSISFDNSLTSPSHIFLPIVFVICVFRIWLLALCIWCSCCVAVLHVSTYFIKYCLPLVHRCSKLSSNKYEYEGRRAAWLDNNILTSCTTFLAFFSSTYFSIIPCKISHLLFYNHNSKSKNASIDLHALIEITLQ